MLIVEPELAERRPFGRTRGAVDLGAGELRELDGGHADAAGRGMDEDFLALLHRAEDMKAIPCGEERHRYGRGFRETESAGDGHDVPRVGDHFRGEGASPGPAHDPVARLDALNTCSDGGHHAG